jgi:peptidoglycan/LPS O-acetylase OafA/YrhL
MTNQPEKSFYRPELDVVRFLAFATVFGHHTISRDRTTHGAIHGSIADALGFGMCLFFSLSAYLITLLLLREKDITGSIHLKQFYQRRILRIWPLYFLALFLGFVYIIVHQVFHTWITWFIAAVFMCGNLVPFNGLIIGHLWSISLEEQFYVFWPTLMSRLRRSHMAIAAGGLLLIANITLFHYGRIHAETDIRVWTNTFVQFEMFAAGIFLALFDSYRPKLSRLPSALLMAAGFGLWFIAAYSCGIKGHPEFARGPASLCTGYALVALGCVFLLVGISGIRFAPKPFVYCGKISYGLYVFHIPWLFLLGTYAAKFLSPDAIPPIALVLAFACAALSYRFFETPFLRMKRKLEIIRTRPV